MNALESNSELSVDDDTMRVERRLFTRLTALASWRSEYILRTRLLRAMTRGKPADFAEHQRPNSARSTGSNIPLAQTTYSSSLFGPVTHLHASFGTSLNKRSPKFIHGADEYGGATLSDPRLGKVEAWGSLDAFPHRQFADVFPGDALYGLGGGDMVGVPNVMDVSQPYGMVYGEGLIAGTLWYRCPEEKRGRALLWTMGASAPDQGIPALMDGDAVCSVWIAKTSNVPDISEGLFGIFAGSSTGVLTAYSLGTSGVRDNRFERGEITGRWILSPGVPIVAITADDHVSARRCSDRRIWAVALNALGETFYLDDVPKQAEENHFNRSNRVSDRARMQLEEIAWKNGRTIQWKLVEPTRRVARLDPFDRSGVDGSYSPRSSCNEMSLSPQQLAAEVKEIATFLRKKPRDFQMACQGWDMQRRLEVDFASSDEHGAGEAICIINCGLAEGGQAEIKRHTRCRLAQEASSLERVPGTPPSRLDRHNSYDQPSIFKGKQATSPFEPPSPARSASARSSPSRGGQTYFVEEWRTSVLAFGGLRTPQITTTAIDTSLYAILTAVEDPLLSPTLSAQTSSPLSSPTGNMPTGGSVGNIPGQRARFLTAGSKTGTIFIWNLRAPVASNSFLESCISPIRIIYTESPQISCLALTALYLVHGGNDGLVQVWDPLASNMEPIRTLNSRFSSRARRRLIQAEASPAGVGINLFAAGAICLDPDPTVLRGMVSLGSHLRYWSYSSLAAEDYKGKKRRPRRSERGSNQGADRFSGTGRGALKEYIANEKLELEKEKRNKRKEEERLVGRFGLDLLGAGASEDEIMAYATMLSEEALQEDQLKRRSPSDRSNSSETVTEEALASPISLKRLDESVPEDEDLAEAIRLSLQDTPSGYVGTSSTSPTISIKHGKKKNPSVASIEKRAASIPGLASSDHSGQSTISSLTEANDLEYALQLSLAEEQSRAQSDKEEDFMGKGKERAL